MYTGLSVPASYWALRWPNREPIPWRCIVAVVRRATPRSSAVRPVH